MAGSAASAVSVATMPGTARRRRRRPPSGGPGCGGLRPSRARRRRPSGPRRRPGEHLPPLRQGDRRLRDDLGHGRGDHCYRCFNTDLARQLEIDYERAEFDPVTVEDAEGRPHTFKIRCLIVPRGSSSTPWRSARASRAGTTSGCSVTSAPIRSRSSRPSTEGCGRACRAARRGGPDLRVEGHRGPSSPRSHRISTARRPAGCRSSRSRCGSGTDRARGSGASMKGTRSATPRGVAHLLIVGPRSATNSRRCSVDAADPPASTLRRTACTPAARGVA